MTNLAASSPDAAVLVSIFKPVLTLFLFAGWAYVASWLDKDLKKWYLPREPWNLAQIGVAIASLAAVLFIPIFWVGLPLALLVMLGIVSGYVFYRNNHENVPAEARWTFDPKSFLQEMENKKDEERSAAAAFRFVSKASGPLPVPGPDHPLFNAHVVISQLIAFAVPRRAQMINFAASAQQTAVEIIIDGVAYSQQPLETAIGVAVIDYVKQAVGLDIKDRRRKQDGLIRIDSAEYGTHQFYVTTLGSTRGLMLTIEIDRDRTKGMAVDKLGLLPVQLDQLQGALSQPGKVVLAAAPPRQGLTTSLYALIATHDPYTQNVLTLEEEIEHELEGVRHEQIPVDMDAAAYNQRLKALLMREVSVMLVGKIFDSQTVNVIAENSEEVRFYVGLRQEDTFAALNAWINAVGDRRLAANAIGAIVAQRLVRKLCTTCRVPYTPSPDALRKINLPPDRVKQLYKHSGKVQVKDQVEMCPTCMGLGFQGQTPVFEVMAIDDEARKLIAAEEMDQLRSHLRRQGTLWMQEAALARAVEGVTSINEITRAMAKQTTGA